MSNRYKTLAEAIDALKPLDSKHRALRLVKEGNRPKPYLVESIRDRPPLTRDMLIDSLVDVAYEAKMLAFTTAKLSAHDLSALTQLDFVVFEAYLIHSGALIEFLYRNPSSANADTVYAVAFFDSPSSWMLGGSKIPSDLEEVRERRNKHVAHITVGRHNHQPLPLAHVQRASQRILDDLSRLRRAEGLLDDESLWTQWDTDFRDIESTMGVFAAEGAQLNVVDGPSVHTTDSPSTRQS